MRQTFITKSLLFDYFAGQVTALQRSQIEEWALEPSNEEFFYLCLHEWELSRPMYQANLPEGIERFHKQLEMPSLADEQPTDAIKKRQPRNPWWTWSIQLAAASFLLISLVTLWLYQEQIFTKTYATNYGQTQSFTLEDGSKVSLNANSSLSVPRFGFGSSTRTVFLKGEADFSVVHTKDDKRFLVKTGASFDVEVLGTEFTVLARENQSKVVLTKGKVNIQYRSKNQRPQLFTMKPGDLVSLTDKGNMEIKKVLHPENYSAWKNNRFVFDKTNLKEIVTLLQNNYGIRAQIEDKELLDYSLSGSFQARNAEELLTALSEILPVSIQQKDKQVIFKSIH